MNSSVMYMCGFPASADTVFNDDTFDHCNKSMICTNSVLTTYNLKQEDSFLSSNQHNFHSGSSQVKSFDDDLYIPNEVAAELEWLSSFLEDRTPYHAANINQHQIRPTISNHGTSNKHSKTVSPKFSSSTSSLSPNREGEMVVQHCTHCAVTKTPQWRTGPQGPKTLCNACGVRYKSGRLVPEYRPAKSPTFVQSQHSNSHRKVLELRRQKEKRLNILI